MKKSCIKVGADPEFFLFSKGNPISGHGLVPGDKTSPHYLIGGAMQLDGVALEININPAVTFEDFDNTINVVLSEAAKAINHRNKDWGYEDLKIRCEAEVNFDPDYWDGLPIVLKELGCDPDFSAYTGTVKTVPDGGAPVRFGAGHVHIGCPELVDDDEKVSFQRASDLVKVLDQTLGNWMFANLPKTRRNETYGTPGTFRSKSYGVEYRTPPNTWVANTDYRRVVFETSVDATKAFISSDFNVDKTLQSLGV